MEYLILETAALMLAAYFLGAIVACFVRRLFFFQRIDAPVESTAQWQTTPLQPATVASGAPVIETGRQITPETVQSDSKRFEKALSEAPQGSEQFESLTDKIETIETPPERPWPPEATGEQTSESSAAEDATQSTADVAATTAVASAAAAAAASAVQSTAEVANAQASTSPEPAAETEPEAAPAEPVIAKSVGAPDDLRRIRSIDLSLVTKLNNHGIYRYEDIANLSRDDVEALEKDLEIPGKVAEESWIAQAEILARGGDTTYTRGRSGQGSTGDIWSSASAERSPSRPKPEEAPAAHPTAARQRTGAEQAVVAAAAVAAATAAANRISDVMDRPERTEEPDAQDTAAPTPDPTPAPPAPESRPTRLADAIQDTADKADEADISDDGKASTISALRSVKSEALRGDNAPPLGDVDDLKRIRGIGVLVEKKLNSIGVSTFQQIAEWSKEDIKRVSELMDFKGRIEREHWIEQAQLLASRSA